MAANKLPPPTTSTPPPTEDRLALRPDEAARMLSISRRTLQEFTARGWLKARRISNRLTLYITAELLDFLRNGPPAEAQAAQE